MKEFKISEQQKEAIIKEIASSVMPTNVGLGIIQLLQSLPEVEAQKEAQK